MQHILFILVKPAGKTNIQEGLQTMGYQVYPSRKFSIFIAQQRPPCYWKISMENKQNLYRSLQEYIKATRDV